MNSSRPRVVVVRGHLATPWELRPWERLIDQFEVSYLRSASNRFEVASLPLRPIAASTLRDRLPSGAVGDIVTGVLGDRYFRLAERLATADIVHAEELSFWFAAEAARAKRSSGCHYRLVQTVWETIPMNRAYRNREARANREKVLAATDLFLAATERAAASLRLEGVEEERVEVCYPGIDVERFRTGPVPETPRDEHVILSAGRLVWEKGHQDVLRAVAALRDGVVPGLKGAVPRVLIVGKGPEERRLRDYAGELGLAERVEFASVGYDDMPAVYARASCLVLASLPMAQAGYHPFDIPRAFWEEQFGLVLAEAMAAGLDIVASASGAIPEVVGDSGTYFSAGDWIGLARALADGPLGRAVGARVEHPRERVERYSLQAAADRLAAAYERALALPVR